MLDCKLHRCGCDYHAAQYFRQLIDGAPFYCITHYLRLEQMHRDASK